MGGMLPLCGDVVTGLSPVDTLARFGQSANMTSGLRAAQRRHVDLRRTASALCHVRPPAV
ncbi:putative leader peptide [Parafrankia discariae]|uniref:putative leader peptide n=1 Tax=Parafrankia discariae TaxID=365528 RepID=UPI003899190F